MAKTNKGGKNDYCWNCGTRLDQPWNGILPEHHGCDDTDCVRCPKCRLGICEYDEAAKSEKADRAKRLKGMPKRSATPRGGAPDGSGSKGGSGGRGGDPKDPKDYLPAVDNFPLQAFPAPIQRYVEEVGRAFGCPIDYAAVAVLVNAAAAIGATREIEVKDSYRVPASIYAGVVGGPGATKTPVLKFVSGPVDRRQDDLLRTFRREWADHKALIESFEKKAHAAKKEARGAKEEKDTKDGTLPPVNPPSVLTQTPDRCDGSGLKKPTLPRIVSSDPTVEALALILSENWRGLLLKRDELVAWVRGMDMYRKGKGTDRQFYMSAYSSAPFVLDRKSNTDRIPIIVSRPFLCVIGCLTPDMLPEFEDEQGRDDGFVDRILWTYPNVEKNVLWTEESVSEESQAAWEACLDRLWALQGCEERGQFTPKAVGLLGSAKRAWIDFYNAITFESDADDFLSRLVGPWRKLRDYGARLTLLIHELRVACGDCRNEEMVEEVSVQAAVQLVDYFKSHALRVHAAMLGKIDLPTAYVALVDAVEKLVTARKGRWSGNATTLLADLCPHAGDAVNDPRWPTSPKMMGLAIRGVGGHLEQDRGIIVSPPLTTDKTRTFIIARKPPKPPSGVESPSLDGVCDVGGSGQPENPTAQTAQDGGGPSGGSGGCSDGVCKPPEMQGPGGQEVTDTEGGLGGSGGSLDDGESDIEDGVV